MRARSGRFLTLAFSTRPRLARAVRGFGLAALFACHAQKSPEEAGPPALATTAGTATMAPGPSASASARATSDAPPLRPTASARMGERSRLDCASDDTFPSLLDVPEASSAAEVVLRPGARELLVVSDSGNDGAALAWSIPKGPARALRLPLDAAASDDIEGIAWANERLYTLTSSGAVRRFAPDSRGGLARDQDAYAVGAAPYICPRLTDSNCGKNYEGLCLRKPGTSKPCAGYAASKAESALYCLVFHGERLAIDPDRPPLRVPLSPNTVSDCAFGAAGGPGEETLLVATNIFNLSKVYALDEETSTLHRVDAPMTPNTEGVAVDRDGALYVLGDTNTKVSTGRRETCKGWANTHPR